MGDTNASWCSTIQIFLTTSNHAEIILIHEVMNMFDMLESKDISNKIAQNNIFHQKKIFKHGLHKNNDIDLFTKTLPFTI